MLDNQSHNCQPLVTKPPGLILTNFPILTCLCRVWHLGAGGLLLLFHLAKILRYQPAVSWPHGQLGLLRLVALLLALLWALRLPLLVFIQGWGRSLVLR